MTYNEFICQCLLRNGAIYSTDFRAFRPTQVECIYRAGKLAENLVKAGIISPPFKLFKEKFEVYRNALQTACKPRYLDGRAGESFGSGDEAVASLRSLIEAKEDFASIAKVLICELVEQPHEVEVGRHHSMLSALIAEAVLGLLNDNSELVKKEKELLDKLALHMETDYRVPDIHKELVASRENEQRVKDRLLELWKNARGASRRKRPNSNVRPNTNLANSKRNTSEV